MNFSITSFLTGVVLSCLPALSVFAQNTSELVTDRPDQTESASIVPTGSLQLEAGFLIGIDEVGTIRTSTWSAPTFLLRVGITETFEVRLGGELSGEQVRTIENDVELSDTSGFGNILLGAKARIAEESGIFPELALLTHFMLPFGDMAPESIAFADMRIAASHSLTSSLGLGYNLGLATDESNPTVLRGLYTVALGTALSERLGSFVEFYGDAPWEDDAAHSFDAGFTWLVAERLQLDLSAGFGLSESAEDYFLSTGVSVRVP